MPPVLVRSYRPSMGRHSPRNSRVIVRWLVVALVMSLAWRLLERGHYRLEAPLTRPSVTLLPSDRLLILAPHPDDEVLGCGGIIQRALAMQVPIDVVLFTYGDNNQWSFLVYRKHPVLIPGAVKRMGLVRHDEAIAAAQALGLGAEHLTFLGYPDFGTMQIWKTHWGDRPPFRSMLTKVIAVPYENARRPGAPYKGEEVLRDLTTIIRALRPTKIFVSHPGDHMPDHAALYLFTRVALWDLESELRPELYPYLVHFKGWPRPRGLHPKEPLEPPALFRNDISWSAYQLSADEVERKLRAIQAHRTQYEYTGSYLLSFIRPNELFGDFPMIPLQVSTSGITLSAGDTATSSEMPEQLTDEERAAFVGVEMRSVWLENRQLVLSIRFSRPLAQAVKASIFIFGYRPDRPFADMPKLHVTFGEFQHTVYDQDRELPNGTVGIHREARQLTVRVPLETLGGPQKILTSARTSLGEVPLDWTSWETLDVTAAVSDGSR